MFRVISNTRDSVSSRISKHLEVNWKFDAQRSIFDEIPGVWITDETLSRVFGTSSQSKQKLRSKRRSKIVKFYAYQDRVSKPSLRLWFSLFSRDELLMSLRTLYHSFAVHTLEIPSWTVTLWNVKCPKFRGSGLCCLWWARFKQNS